MGNCLVIQDRKEIIKIMSVDGSSEVLRVPSPSRLMKVHDDSLGEPQPLPAASVLPVNAPAGTVRVKLVISKRELKKMLDKEGVSLDDVVSLMRKEASDSEQEEGYCCGGWRTALESIPESSDL
ncbi:uncharacterized protein [Miscanthus floridulus]|uniref:uncharacterized protein n=1 Tax=Miscanthus floridulus TaxID=154761 RepID=UPI00345AFD72